MIIRNFPKQTNNLLPFELNSNKFSSYYGYPNYGYTGSYQNIEFPITQNGNFLQATSGNARVPEPIYSSGVQRSTRINYLPSSQSCAPFQSHADCDKSPNSKGGESYDWNYGWNSCCSGFCPSKRECAKPDPKECDIGNDILDRDPFLKIEWDVNAPNYRCTYDLHK